MNPPGSRECGWVVLRRHRQHRHHGLVVRRLHDDVVPGPHRSFQSAGVDDSALQRKEVPSRLVVFPGAGHWPSWYEMAFYYNAHLDWFHQYLGGGEAPYDVQEFARNQIFEKDDEGGSGEE